MMPSQRTLRERLLSRLIIDSSGCLLWTGSLDRLGYGRIRIDGRSCDVHRVMYEMFSGPVPVSLELDHLCRAPACANVAHLEPVTHRENVLRGTSRPAVNAQKTHCDQGHPFDEANTYRPEKKPSRLCRSCNRDAVRRYKARKKARRP